MSGKAYDVVSYEAQDPDVMVFLSSPAESKLGMYALRHALPLFCPFFPP